MNMKKEPVVIIGLIAGVVETVLAALQSFSVIDASQHAAVVGAAAAIVPVAGALIARSYVWPEHSVDGLLGRKPPKKGS